MADVYVNALTQITSEPTSTDSLVLVNRNTNEGKIIDYNKLQIDGPVADIIGPAPFEPKLEAFGYNVITVDGHSFEELEAAFKSARACGGRPTAIVANTVKGRGVSFMENKVNWHGSAPKDPDYEIAVAEIKARIGEG